MKRVSADERPLQDLRTKLPAQPKNPASPAAKPATHAPEASTPAAVVVVGQIPKGEEEPPATYSPAELRAKALRFLESGKASSEERAVLAKQLGAKVKTRK